MESTDIFVMIATKSVSDANQIEESGRLSGIQGKLHFFWLLFFLSDILKFFLVALIRKIDQKLSLFVEIVRYLDYN
jgi:hypothetical protein